MNVEEAKKKIENCDTSWYCQEAFDTLLKEIERLNNIINKGIEYILGNDLDNFDNINNLLNILKGSDKE